MNSISALIIVISIVSLSILEMKGCEQNKTITDNKKEQSVIDKKDSLIKIQYKADSIVSIAGEQKERSFRKL